MARLAGPGPGDGLREIPVEVRRDPLTGRTVHLAHFGAIGPQPLELDRYAEPSVKGHCPFCPENRDTDLPRFPEDLVPGGVLERGEALLVPNLYPYDVHSSVCIVGPDHVVPLERLRGQLVGDALALGLAYWRRILQVDPARPYPLMGWNYLPPSGGGLVHPHQQYLLTDSPGAVYAGELAASEAFAARRGRTVWEELLEVERGGGERWIGRTGPWEWVAAFAPSGVLGEVLGILPGAWTPRALGEAEIAALVDGFERIFAWFRSAGHPAFNATLVAGPAGQEHFAAHLRIVPRTFLNTRDHAGDFNFLQVLLGEPVCVVRPEELAREVRAFFGEGDPSDVAT